MDVIKIGCLNNTNFFLNSIIFTSYKNKKSVTLFMHKPLFPGKKTPGEHLESGCIFADACAVANTYSCL